MKFTSSKRFLVLRIMGAVLITVALIVYTGFYVALSISDANANALDDYRFEVEEPLLKFDNITLPPPGYLVYSNSCRMRRIEPFTDEIFRMYTPVKPMNCTIGPRYVYRSYDAEKNYYRLHMNVSQQDWFVKGNDRISCCYKQIIRNGEGANADRDYRLSSCRGFKSNFIVPRYFNGVIVVCRSVNRRQIVYKDAFYFIQQRDVVIEHLRNNSRKINDAESDRFGMLLFGIDSLSQINFRRTMPKTFAHLVRNGWFELSGYNKIDDNTFPNLMAILAGFDFVQSEAVCHPKEVGGLDKCPTLLKTFHERGFVTAYAEDETYMSTFNYLRKGFLKPPTDYYLQPFMIAIEKNLPIRKQSGLNHCIGNQRSVEYVYDFGIEFATRFLGERALGMFWSNSFSHNSYDTPSSMDERIHLYMQDLQVRGILDKYVVVLFSDHGSRTGQLRSLSQGFMEERLPIFFIWLPKQLQEAHPEFVYALLVNQYRLTSPYDVFLTLQELLNLSAGGLALKPAKSCLTCQSLLRPVKEDRNCTEAGISEHWCTCTLYAALAVTQKHVQLMHHVVGHINTYLEQRKMRHKCQKLMLKTLYEINMKTDESVKEHPQQIIYRARFDVLPRFKESAEFEVTFGHCEEHNVVSVDVPKISRLNLYAEDAFCINDKESKKFCICRK